MARLASSDSSSDAGVQELSQAGLEVLSQGIPEVVEDLQEQSQDDLETETALSQSSLQTSTEYRAVRLAALIRARCSEVTIEPHLEPQAPRVRTASGLSRQEAHSILVANRRSSSKKRNSSDPSSWKFTDEEKSQALKDAVECGRVDLAEALLDMGLNVNAVTGTIRSGILRRHSLISSPVNYISTAVLKNDVDMVHLIASRGISAKSLEDALYKAVRQNLPKMVETLLRLGADPNAMSGTIFETAVRSQKIVLIKLLLRARTKVHKNYLTENLLQAVTQGQADLVSLLIGHGADVNHEVAAALREAVQNERVDLVLIIMKAKPTIDAVSSVFNNAFSLNGVITSSERKLLVETLLCGGARGHCVDEALVQVVRNGESSLASLLVKYGASPRYHEAESLRIAIQAGDIKLVKVLLQGSVSSGCLIDRFDDIPRPFVMDRTYEMMSILLSKVQGATGTPLDKALVVSVEQRLINITELLLNHKASVNYNEAQALHICVSRGDLNNMKLLLNKGRPQHNFLQHLLPQIPPAPQRLRYEMTKSIVDAAQPIGIPTPILDTALMEAVDSPSELADLDLINFILDAGANVNCLRGRCLHLATQKGCLSLLELLVRHNPEPTSVSSAITQVVQIKEPAVRRRATNMLLDHGAQGPDVSRALDDILGQHRIDEELVRSLLIKVDINYRGGQLLSKVVISLSPSIVSSVLRINKPDQPTLDAALPALLDPCTEHRQEKLSSLLQAGTSREALAEALIREISNGPAYSFSIVKMLLDQGASCNHDGGKAIELAMLSKNVMLLGSLLSSKPDQRILASLLPAAISENDGRLRCEFVSMLLHSGAQGDQVHSSLTMEVNKLSGCNLQIVELLVRYGARVDFLNADAIKHVLSRPLHIDILKALCQGEGASNILASLIPLAMAHEQCTRLKLLSVLFSHGATGAEVSSALINAVSEGPASQLTIDLLLKNQASANFENGRAIKLAATNGHDSILECLLENCHNPQYRSDAFEMIMSGNALTFSRRLSVVRLLTRAGLAINAQLHSALIQAVREQDHNLTKCLLESHADPNFDNGKSVIIATERVDIETLEILATVKPHQNTYTNAFTIIADDQKMMNVDSQLVLRVRRHLLQHGAAGPSVDQKFLDYMTSLDPLKIKFIDTVLACGSSLDIEFKSGLMLCVAVRNNAYGLVSILLSRQPSENTLLTSFYALLESDLAEDSLLAMLHLFMDHSGDRKCIYFEGDDPSRSPLYLVLHHHADKPKLLEYLLENGCSVDAHFTWIFTSNHGMEEVSALLWLLCQADQKLNTGILVLLLEHGADPNFRTAKSGISPLIMAATSSSVESVLKLLEFKADPNTEDECNGTPLYYATRAKRLEIMELLLDYEADPNDESLHVACQNLDTPGAKLLLDNGASVSLPGFSLTGSLTPLENLCCNANPKRNAGDLKRLLKLLAKAKPNLNKLDPQGKVLVFQALDNLSPFEMTMPLLAAFPILCETMNEDQIVHRDRDGCCYSPTMYVRHFKCARFPHNNPDIQQPCCNLSECPALPLEKALRASGCQHRYWHPLNGANQPEFACGFPPDIAAAIKAAEETRKRHEAEERARQAENQERREEQDRLDEDARAVQRREQERLDVIAAGERQIAVAVARRIEAEEAAVARRIDAEETEAQKREAREMRRLKAEEAAMARRLEAEETEAQKREARELRRLKAEEAAVARRLEAEETEVRRKEAREMRRLAAERIEMRLLEDDKEKLAQRREDRTVATMQKQANIRSKLIQSKQKTIQNATVLAKELKGQLGAGRILGEVIDDRLLLQN